jgi:16S rRNA (uracil1498-N3)-methyltransferase
VTAPVFFVPREHLAAADVRLDGAEGRHAAVVRRLAVGEDVVLASGDGLAVRGVVSAVVRDGITVAVNERWEEPEPQPRFVVVQALAKGARAELAVELLTEIGVDEIVPWSAARCVVRWSTDRGDRPLARWQSTAREAAKQSRRIRLPVVSPLATTADVAERLADATRAVVLHEGATQAVSALDVPADGTVVVVVGPEGGITDEEITAFGVAPVRLGPTVLRTSTAGLVAASILLGKTDRWSG